jgi:SiaC family regulatory phosphoprotein
MMYPDILKNIPTKKTPWVILEPGRIFIMGRSIPENPGDFYRPILDWISKYADSYTGKTRMEFGFEYVNTSSTKWIYTLLKQISGLTEIISMTELAWYYERGDEDMYELGLILRSLVECSFDIVEIYEMNPEQYERIYLGK